MVEIEMREILPVPFFSRHIRVVSMTNVIQVICYLLFSKIYECITESTA